jgi:PIN domain nuclease of toxin-antitoxin system
LSSTRNFLLDTTYLMPVFGIDVGVDSSSSIQETLGLLAKKGAGIFISDLSPLEGFIKAYRIAEKLKDEGGKQEAKLGLLFIVRGGWATRINHLDDDIIEEAFKIRSRHSDPFDCFIFATAKAHRITLVTEDEAASDFLEEKLVMTWNELKRLKK